MMEEVRRLHELPFVSHFLHTKADLVGFNFPGTDIRTIEEGICDPKSLLFKFAAWKILCLIKKTKDILFIDTPKILDAYAEENKSEYLPLVKGDLTTLSGPEKLRILKWLVDETKDKKNELDEMLNEEFGTDGQMDSTIINVGQDSEGRIYWYFDDLRLYRQKAGQPKSNCDWQCLATTCATWESVINTFSQSTDESEKELYTYLNNDIYPAIKPLLETQTKEARVLSNQEILAAESLEMENSKGVPTPAASEAPPTPTVDQSELIKSENPELSKVLSEEPYAGRNSTAQINGDTKKGGGNFTQRQNSHRQSPQHQQFVFSTQMAMRAAESVATRTHPSIIQGHLNDPETKQFLQDKPMKVMVPNVQTRHPMMPQKATNPYRQHRPLAPTSNPNWKGAVRPGYNQPTLSRQMSGGGGPYMNHDMMSPMNARPISMAQPNLSQQSVPDEELTPDQRMQRHNKLANIRHIKQMLLPDNGGVSTDFSHIHMAQDTHPSYQSPSHYNYGMSPQSHPMEGAMSMYGLGHHMIHNSNTCVMESKPPPPYPIPSPSSVAQPAPAPPKKAGRKRKTSSVASPAPTSPLDVPPVKMEKSSIPPSPLASHPTSQQMIAKSEEIGLPGPMRSVMHNPMTRQNSMPNFPQPRSLPQPGGPPYRMLQAGQPTLYQNSEHMFGGPGNAPPSYHHSLRRGMSAESMTAPPSQRHMYMQPENQERAIQKELNSAHQPNPHPLSNQVGGDIQQQPMYGRPASQPNMDSRTNNVSNMTSASLANLAKGMEQMSQKMSHNGPYGDLQNPGGPECGTEQPMNAPPTSSSTNQQIPSQPSHPRVNNTFVNTHMSIGQVNIQNVTANQNYHGPAMPGNMQQNVDVSMNNFVGGMPSSGAPAANSENMFKPAQPAPSAPAVSIQNKGSSTIQYHPVSQPTNQPSHDTALPAKHNLDYMPPERFSSPGTNFLTGENHHNMMIPPGPSMPAPQRHLAPMYGAHPAPPGGGHMMPGSGPMSGSMHMTESVPRGATPPYMLSSQHSSISMAYNQPPAPGASHPGSMDTHMHMRGQSRAMVSSGYQGHLPMRAAGYNVPPGYTHPVGPTSSAMPLYGPPGAEYGPAPGAPPHHMGMRAPAMHQPMVMSHQPGPYMGNPPNPPFM